jgi:hypothetical protein
MKDWIWILTDSIRRTDDIQGKPPYTARLFGIIGIAFFVSLQTIGVSSVKKNVVLDGWTPRAVEILHNTNWVIAWIEATWAVILLEMSKTYLTQLKSDDIQKLYDDHLRETSPETQCLMTCLSPFSETCSTHKSMYKKIQCIHAQWKKDFLIYLERRQDDGWKNAQIVPHDLPNRDIRIPVGNYTLEEEIDLETFLPDPSKFALLTIYDDTTLLTQQTYLGPQFGRIHVSNIVPDTVYKTWKSFMIDSMPSETCRKDDIWSMRHEPDDVMKCRAELWSGSSKNYLNPPCQLVWWVCLYLNNQELSPLDTLAIMSNVMLGVFVVGVICWDLKYTLLQPRPIQDFRRWFPTEKITQWRRGDTTGRHWLPYQKTTFVTPPFPDIPSGHSCFSSVTSSTMRFWTQRDECFQFDGSKDDLCFLSPLLRQELEGTVWNGCRLTLVPSSSQIDPHIPHIPISFQLMQWSTLANEIGQSRVDGGIHTHHTNLYSLNLGDMVARYLYSTYFDIAKKKS